jgi:hypothetical protein
MHAFTRPIALSLMLVVSGCGVCWGSTPPPSILPLRTLRLYETGVGYFERSGTLTPHERTSLPIPASHLDDALESLVVLTPGHAEPMRGIAFGSSLSHGMARAMAGLPTDADAPITWGRARRGAALRVREETPRRRGSARDRQTANPCARTRRESAE